MNSYKFFGINGSLHNKEYQSHYTYKTMEFSWNLK